MSQSPADPSNAVSPTSADLVDEDKKTRTPRKIFVIVGDVYEFESANKAEKFLNAEGAPSEYHVLRGNRIGISTKVSLR